MSGQRNKALVVSAADRAQLELIARSRNVPAALARRAQMILSMADGESNSSIARRYRYSRPTVASWRARFLERGIIGLHDEMKPGRPRRTSEEQLTALMNSTLQDPSASGEHWSTRALGQATGLSKTTVHRYLSVLGVQSQRSRSVKLSNSPVSVQKVRDIVGLYLNSPDHALVLCVDEKIALPTGYLEGTVKNYISRGAMPLLAALEVANYSVLTRYKARQRHQEFVTFLRHIEASVPAHLELHVLCDSNAHQHLTVRTWLAQRPRFQCHFTPTYSSWLHRIERWFAIITNRVIGHSSLDSRKRLRRNIDQFNTHYSQHPMPFMWIATEESILGQRSSNCKDTSGTEN